MVDNEYIPYDKPSINHVHKQIIHSENIKKENKYENVNKNLNFNLSPYTCKLI